LFTGQADRFVIGYILGTQAVVYYTISVQAAQPIHGIASAGLHVLFPHLGVRFATMTRSGIREKIKRALALNAALILVLAGTLIAGSRFLLQHWMGRDFAAHAAVPLAIISCSYALLGLNVTAHYILMAMGRMRFLALLNALAAVVMLAAMVLLAKRFGLIGAASARLIYGPITWIVYPALAKMLRSQKVLSPADGLRSAYEVP
jgi:O-antigen/teichoic acid export membrane protein